MVYDYVCDKCNSKETKEVELKDYKKVQYCKKCKAPLRKLFGSFGLKTNDGYKS